MTHSLCVRAERVHFTYPGVDKSVLRDLNFHIPAGESLAVLGPNGSGKSTLGKLLAGLIPPSSGRLEILGQDLSQPEGKSALMGQVGIVFQSPDEQMVATTVEREIAFGLENLGVPPAEIRSRVDELMDRFSLTVYAQRSPHLLSGGEKQRLALASVLAMQPKLLILDEVTSLLDSSERLEIRRLIEDLKGLCTLILITQFPRETLIADRVIVISEGRIAEDAPPFELFRNLEFPNDYAIDVPLIFRLLKAAGCADNPPKK